MATHSRPRRGFAPAQAYCALAGAALLGAGVLGFLANASFGGAGNRDELIVFDVNGWHNVVHILSGLLLLAVVPSAKAARAVALAFGLTYGLVAIIGIVDGSDVFGLLPINTADNVLHVGLAALGVLAGLAPAPRATTADDSDRGGQGISARPDASSTKQVFVGFRG